jgi:hypothetical protein
VNLYNHPTPTVIAYIDPNQSDGYGQCHRLGVVTAAVGASRAVAGQSSSLLQRTGVDLAGARCGHGAGGADSDAHPGRVTVECYLDFLRLLPPNSALVEEICERPLTEPNGHWARRVPVAGVGREATDLSSDSSPESGQ